MKAAREAGATSEEMSEAMRMVLRVRQVTLDAHEAFTLAVKERLKTLTAERTMEGGENHAG
jgi:hypothetical protein